MNKYLASIIAGACAASQSFAAPPTTIELINSDITSDTTLSSTKQYVLTRPIFVKSGATLTIPAGTILRGQPRKGAQVANDTTSTPGALIVTQEGRIRVQGTATNPVIMTTAAVDTDNNGVADNDGTYFDEYVADNHTSADFYDDDPLAEPLAPLDANGDANVSMWGGVVVLGNAPTNLGNSASLGLGKATVEGLTVPGFPVADATYGGVEFNDNSGSIEYLSVRHAGDEIGDGNELNGITLAGVGAGTRFENIEVYCNFDDGIEWFGGTVSGKNLSLTFIGDDSTDTDQGYAGNNQNVFIVMPFFKENGGDNFGSKSGDKAGEWDGDDSVLEFKISGTKYYRPGDSAVGDRVSFLGDLALTAPATGSEFTAPLSNPHFMNVTVLGSEPAGNGVTAVQGSNQAYVPTTQRGSANGIEMRHGFAGTISASIIVNTADPLDVKNGNTVNYKVDGATQAVSGDPYFGQGSLLSDTVDNANAGLVVIRQVSVGSSEDMSSNTANTTAMATGDALSAATIAADKNYPASLNLTASQMIVQPDQSFNPQGNASGKLVGTLKATKLDPRAKAGVYILNQFKDVPTGFDELSYRGAFSSNSATDLWVEGWTALSLGGILD